MEVARLQCSALAAALRRPPAQLLRFMRDSGALQQSVFPEMRGCEDRRDSSVHSTRRSWWARSIAGSPRR